MTSCHRCHLSHDLVGHVRGTDAPLAALFSSKDPVVHIATLSASVKVDFHVFWLVYLAEKGCKLGSGSK